MTQSFKAVTNYGRVAADFDRSVTATHARLVRPQQWSSELLVGRDRALMNIDEVFVTRIQLE